MHRFYIDGVAGDTAVLTDAGQFHHLKDVLRLKAGDNVAVFDGEGNEYAGVIESIEKKQAMIKVAAVKRGIRDKIRLTIACAIPKGDRMDDVVDQLTQLGVARIIPMWTERVVVKLDEAKKEARFKRWQTIAQSAAEQSGRVNLPVIMPVTPVADVVTGSQNYDLKLIPHLSGDRKDDKRRPGRQP